jgi:hypothetical protein
LQTPVRTEMVQTIGTERKSFLIRLRVPKGRQIFRCPMSRVIFETRGSGLAVC